MICSRDILRDLGQLKVLYLVFGNSSYLCCKMQHELSLDHVVALLAGELKDSFWVRRNCVQDDLTLACGFLHKGVIPS